MYFNRKNTEQKNWRMIKKGKHFLFGCSLVLAIGGTFVASSVKADTVEPQPESSSTNEEEKLTSKEESSTYVAPAVTVASTTVTETNTAPATDEKPKEESETRIEKSKESDAIQAPSLTVVADPAALTEEEKANVAEAVKGVNPTATDVQVQSDGTVVVTFADGSSATLTPSQTIKVGSQVAKPRRARAASGTTPATRATEGSQNLDYSNKDNPEGYIKMSYEVDDAQNTIHWSVVVNGGRIGNQTSGYSYFTVPKDSVGAPTNWRVLQTDKNGNTMSDRRYWKNNDGIYTMGGAGRMNLYTGSEMTKELTKLYEGIGNPAIKGNEAAAAQQASERSQALYTLTADVAGGIAKNPSWTITFDTPIVDKSKTLDYTAGLQGTGAGKKTNIMTGYVDNFIDNASSKFQAVAVKEKYTAKVGGSFDATPANYVTNKAGTPEFPNNYRGTTTFAWKDGQAPTATTPGTYTKTVVVTYPAHYNQALQEVTIAFEVEGETPKPAGQAPEITSNLDGKASTPADVTVKAPAGSTVKLYNKDGVVIGEAVANDQGVATITPTNSLPAGEITATTTPAGGTESAKSAPITVTKTPTPYTDPGETNAPYYKLGVGTNTTQVSVYRGDNLLLLGGGASSSLRWFGVTPETIGNVKGLKYTEFLRTRTNAQGKLEGPVAWDQPLGETKVVFGATGSENATSRKLLSVYRPITVTVLETTKKYDPVAGTKVDVADSNNLSVDDKNKVIAAVKAANANSDLPLPADSQYSVDEKGNLTITYPDGSTDKIAAAYLVNPTKDTTAPDKPVVNTDLTGKAGTKTPVEVTAEKGSTVALYDKDNNKIGEATAGENGKATITPTVDIPAGAVTAKATDAAGNTSVASDPATATPAADTEAPAKPVVNTDLTGKAGTKTPVEVTAEKGSTVALYDKDNNKIGEATAGENGKATITPTVNIPAGAVTAKATDAAGNTSVASDPATATATVVAPTVEIPYSNKDKEVYVYAGEENSFDIKFKDDSGKIVSATVKQGGNREFGSVAGEANTINTQYGFKANVISSETPATAESPAVITYRGTPAATDGLKPEVLEAATKGENPAGMVLGWRYATATDTDGAFIENKAVGSSTATDPGAFRVVLKAQSQKYDIATPTEKVTVADPANVTEAELGKIKEKLKLEYSQTNDDANLADKKGTTADKTNKIQSVAKDADGNLVVTYTDGSQDKKPLSEFVTKAPTVELPYSNQEHKQIYVYTGENTDLTFKAADDTAVKDMYVRGPGGIGEDNTARYGFTTGKIENSAVTHGDGTVSGATATIKMTGVTTLKAPNRWTSFVVANDNDNAPSNTDFNALDKNPNATKTPGYVQFIVKSQTDKYDIATPAPADKVEVADPTNVTNDDLDKIKEKLQLEYNKKNDDANISKDSPVDKNGKIKSVTKDDQGNLVVTYTDGSTDTKPLTEFVTKKPTTPDTEAPAKPVVDTDLTGKAGTKTPVVVSAEPGSKVELFDKDGNKIGEATADKNGKATITPTVEIPEGNVTAKATDPSGNVSVPSEPAKATTGADTEAPAKPVVDTDLTGKAGTKTPVVVSAEPGSKVELFDKDGNKIGEATADENGKATITPTVEIPAGAVTAKATDPAGNTSVASDPATASADTEAPAKPVVNTDLTGKAGTKTPVEVSAEPGTKVELFDKDGNKIGEATADENGKATITPTVEIPAGAVTAKATDAAGNTSVASDPATASADTEAPAKPVVNTDLTGKAGTKTPVEVSAEPGTKVELFDKDGNKIGEATADENGKATITPTVEIPAGAVTAKATDAAGNTSVASDPATASADTEAPAKPVVNTDLTGKAGTKTPVEVSAEPGTKVELFDKDGNKIGEATADENGKATITPTVDIPAGAVTAKATDPAGNVSEASDPAKATADTEAPAKPVVNTDLTGKAGTKTPVEVSAEPGTKVELFDKDGNKIGEATADENGKATITPTVEIPAGAVTAKATDPAGNVSEASDPATASADTEAPAKPVVNTDLTGKAGTKTPVEVSAEPGTKVELFDKDGNKIGEATADENGKATITPTVEIPAGAVTAKATDPAGNVSEASDPATASADTEAPAKPVVNTDLTGKAGTKTPVEVNAEPGSTVALYDKDNNKIGEATADENGKATITPTVDIPAGAVTAKATDAAGNTSDASDPATASADTEAPAKPVVNTDLTGKAGTKTPVEVNAEPGSTVALYDKDGNKIGEATADENGKATITPTVDIPAGAVTAKATDPAGNVSEASDPAKATADTEAPAKPVVNTDLTGKAGTKTPVEVSAEPGTKVELFDKDGNKIGEATADENGKATITPTVDIPAGAVTAKATDAAGNTSDASDPATASADTEAPAKPVVNTDLTGKAGTKTPVEVSAEPGTKVELFDKDGNKIGEATADENGKATITPTVDIPAGAVTAKATDAAGNTSDASDPATASADTEAPAKPVVNTDLTGKAGTKTPVEVNAEPGSTVALYDKDNNKIGEATADENGKATITPTVDIPAGAVTAKATDAAGNTSDASDPATASADTEAPAKPVVNTDLTGKAGTKTPVEVNAEPGSTVALYDKDGNKIGEATADENGKATITPTVDIPAGAVTAKATDPAGNVSEASDPAKATADTEAPAKPVVNTDLTGKAGTKTPVEVSAEPGTKVELFDKDGNKIGEATADENGKATITPTVDIPAGAVTAKATDAAGNTSDASDPATASADTEAPAKPVVNTDLTGKAGTKTPVEVSAEPGTKVELFDKDGNKIGEATADENGKATITPTVDIPAGAVTAKATDAAGNTSEASDPATASADTEAPAKPVVNTDLTGKAGTKTPVEVNAEPGSTVALYDKDNNKIGEATADENGKATITPTVDIPAGAVTAKATDAAGNTSDASDPATASADTEAPAKPVVNTDLTGKAGTKTPVEVNAEPGSTVALYDKDGNKIGEATADENGKATITPTVDIPAGAVTAKATDPAGNVSEASDPAKATADTEAPAKPVVNTDLTGKAGTKTPVEVSAEPGTKVELFDKDGNKIGEATADENGKATITPTVDIPAGAVTAKATDAAGNTSDASDPATASADTEAPAKPVVNTDLTGKAGTKTPVEVSAEPGTKVELFDKDGNKIGEATADENGKATITPTVDIPAGAVTAKATDAAGNTSDASDPATASADTEAPAKPVVNTDLTGKAGTKTPVEVNAEPGSTVALYDKDNNKIGEATADENGKATITPTVDIPAGAVTAKATDAAGNTSDASDPATASADTEAPAKPVVNTDLTGKAGTKTPVEVNAEPGSTVALYDKDGNKIGEATADENGKATITPTVDIPAGAVTAKATDPAGNVSEASDPAKATADTEAPAKPVVNTDLTGKAGTKTPVEVSAEPGTKVELFDKDGNKIGEATADENGKATITPTVDIPAGAVTAKATDAAGNTSDASDPATASADTEAPAKPVVNTDLTGKAGTKTPVEVNAEPGSTVALYDKDNNKIGEATADENGKATITPTVDIPAGAVTAKATDAAGNTSDASDPATASADTEAPAKPVVNTDLTGKAGTKTPVEVNAEPGSTVALYDKDGNKIGEATADENGKATITPTVDIPAGAVTAKATDPAGNVSEASDPATASADNKAVKDPAVTPVVDPSNLTDAEKAKVADEVKKANPTASKVEVGNDGTATVTYPDGTSAVIPAAKTVKKADDKSVKDPAVTPVVDPSNLTDAEKAKVADEVKKANPTASKVEVGNDGTATVTYPDGTSAVIPADKTVKKADDKSVKDPAVTPVVDPSNLTDAEKAKVADEVKKANPTASKVEVGNDGTATVTYPDGTSAVIPADKTVKKSDDKAVKDPTVTPVVDPSNLTDAEKAKVADEVKKANPSASKVEVGNDGTATVTYPDGTTAVIPADKTVKKSDDKSVKDPAVTPVVDPSNLTDAEKAKVADEVKKANPSASKVEVGNDGTATVTYPDGTTAVIPAANTVKKADDKAVKDPTVTPVVDPSNLTDAEKAKVADEVKKANPSASKVEVGNDGTATVTYPDGTSAVIPADKTVKKSDDKSVKDPAVTPVVDPSNLTDAEKAKVADEVKKANPSVTDVTVGNDGTATVTYPDGTSAVIPADKTVKKSDDKSVKDPAVTPVVDPSNLTDAEKAKVADEVKKANPSASKVEVGNDGTATVTYPDGTSAVIPAANTVKKSDDKDPAVTPVVDPSNLTDAEKAKVADEVKKANPTASKVEVGNDGTATVTYPDGTTAVIPADKTVKKSDDKSVKDPAVTPVVDPSNLTDAEKAKVADEVKKANPTASKVEVGNDGTATVTYPDGTTAVIPAANTVKKSDDKSVKDPAVTPVVDPSNLTDAEKAKVADEVKKANPTASKVEVGNDGTATVTYPDGTSAVIPAAKTVKKSDDKSVKDPAVTPVVDPSNLTDAEKAKVADEVKKANPTASKVEVGNDGTATVTYPDGTTAVIPADKTVKKSDDKSVKDPAVTPVVDPSNLTDAEKAKVADEVKKANPTASKVEVGNDGTATVTYPDGTTAVIPADKTVKKADDKSVKDPVVTPVVDPSNLTDAEKAKVADEVKKANPTASKVEVGNDGTATVTYPDGTTAVIPADKTVKKSDDKSVKDPAVTPVVDPSNLTDAEKAKVADEVKKANPTASKVEVGNDGTATVTYPDGTTAVIPADKTVKKSDDKSVKDPAVTPVVDPSNLTDAEKAKVADEVKKANPTASKVEVGNDGTATVTYPDGTTAVIPADKTVKKSDDKSVKDPAVTPVVDPSNLTDAEKAKVADEVKKANPTASKVEVGNDGTATVTFPDGSVAVLIPAKTVKVADSNGVKNPSVTPVVNPSALTDAEKAKVADEVKKANPTASKVEVGNDGTATVTYPDGTTAILTPKQTIKKVSETGNKGNSNSSSDNNSDKTSNTFVKVPAEKTLVKDPSNLTDAERSEIVSKIKQVNPGATVKVDRYGNATVELNGKNVVISSEQLIVSAKETNGQASHQGRVATDSSKKSESGKLPSTGEEQSVASIGLAILSALTGGLLLSKKRKEEE